MRKYFDQPKIKNLKSDAEPSRKTTEVEIVYNLISASKFIGFSIDELRKITVGQLLSFIDLRVSSSTQSEKSNIRDATQADIDAFLC